MAEIHISTYNNEVMSYCDYIYNRYMKRDDKVNWMCQKCRCSGRATTVFVNGELQVEVTRQHNHFAHPLQVAVLRVKSNIRKKAMENYQLDSTYLVTEEVKTLTPEVRAALPQLQQLRRLVRECRDCLPGNLIGLLIPESRLKTLIGTQFLLHDNIINNEVDQTTQRTIIFATRDNMRWLFRSNVWYVDASFGVEDSLFLQIWTILGRVGDSVLPLAYVFMQTQQEEEYLGALLTLQQKAAYFDLYDQNPSMIMVDLSGRVINAIASAFPKARVCLPLFQFKQSLYSEMKVTGLQAGYDATIKQWLWSAIGLAYIPPADVVQAFELLVKQLDQGKVELADVARYLDRNYIRGQMEPDTLKMLPPRYPIKMWNIYERILTNEVIDDSVVENWYNKFGKTILNCSGTLGALVDIIRTEQDIHEEKLSTGQTGQKGPRRTFGGKRMTKIERVKECVMGYQEFKSAGKLLQYLTTMGSYHVLPMS